MTDAIAQRVADWLNGSTISDNTPPPDIWAAVEIFGHRKHYGRVREVERFGTKMLRIDVPAAPEAPLLGQDEVFETFLYGGGSIFSFTPMTEKSCREWAKHYAPSTPKPLDRLPPPAYDYEDEGPQF